MQVKPGYKDTEMGFLPDDWEVRRLSEHFRIYAGGDVPKHSLSQTRSGSHPYPIFANALHERGLYGYTNERRSQADSLTITARGYLGHAEYRDQPFFPIVRLLVLEPCGQLDAKFTSYAINDRVEFAIESTGVPQLTAPQVGKYSVAAPPTIQEQRAIAPALSDVDALLGGLDRLIAKKRDLKPAAMQELLTGKKRLPGFSVDWHDSRLRDLLSYERPDEYIVQDTEYSERGDIPVLTANKSFVLGYTVESFGICRDLPAIVFDDFTTASKYVTFPFKVKSAAIKLLRRKHDRVDLRFVFERMQLIRFPLGDHKRYYISEFQNLEFATPEIAEQRAIVAVLSDMDSELAALEQRRD